MVYDPRFISDILEEGNTNMGFQNQLNIVLAKFWRQYVTIKYSIRPRVYLRYFGRGEYQYGFSKSAQHCVS